MEVRWAGEEIRTSLSLHHLYKLCKTEAENVVKGQTMKPGVEIEFLRPDWSGVYACVSHLGS